MDELISEFLAETNESLGDLDNQLITLEQNPEDKETVDSIFRVMHTIKGTCGFLELNRLASVAHASEDVLDNIRAGKLTATGDVISLVLESIDCIKELVEHLEAEGAEPDGSDEELINRLKECAEGKQVTAEAPPEAVTEESEEAAEDSADLQAAFDAAPGPDDEADGQDSDDLQAAFDAAPGPDDETPGQDSDDLQAAFDAAPGPDDEAAPPAATDEIPQKAKEEAIDKGLEQAKQTAAKPPKAPATQSIRVHLHLLEALMQMASELVLTRNQLLQINRRVADSAFTTPLQRLSHITTDLQESVMKTRMQPISNAWSKFPRLIRDLSLELDKKIELVMIGEETELDRQMLEMIKDPLTHMVRNAADHGMDTPEERKEAGKNETGKITLNAFHEGGHIIVKISDDGRGINRDKVAQKAIENGLTTEAEVNHMDDKQIYQFILKPGFSTAEKITSVSGRGVGMDVVVSNIVKIGGTLEVESKPGKGSDFIIKLPLTLAIMSVLVVESTSQRFAIPQIRVSEVVYAAWHDDNREEEFTIEIIKDSPVLRLRGELLPLVTLKEVLGIDDIGDEETLKKKRLCVVICEVGASQFGIIVDQVFDTEEIVVKPLSPMLSSIDIFSGCTILGDGSIIMILDLNGITKTMSGTLMHKKSSVNVEESSDLLTEEGLVNFLLFDAGGKTPKAVPVELVSRLEEIEMDKTEWASDNRVIQYGGELMRIVGADSNFELPNEGICEVIVFSDEGKVLGLAVEAIIDIIEHKMDVRSMTAKDGVLGNLVISGVTYDLVDISYYFSNVFKDWLATRELSEEAKQDSEQDKRILLVDDSPFFRKFMKPILVVANYSVVTAESAHKALEILESDVNFDAVITDIDMPEMTGIEFVKVCKADERFAHLPFIALTSYSSSDIMEGDNQVGFSGFVSKSDRDKLVETIADVLSNIAKAA